MAQINQIAEFIGVSPSYVSMIKNRDRDITLGMAKRLAQKLGRHFSAYFVIDRAVWLAEIERKIDRERAA